MGLSQVIKLASNENCLGPSPLAVQAMAEALTGLGRYGDADSRRLREAIAKSLNVEPERILAGNGSSEFLVLMTLALLEPGLSAIMSRPSFTLYASTVMATGARAIQVPVTSDFGHDLKAIAAKVDPSVRLIFLDNPLNPTGAWLTREDLKAFHDQMPNSCLLVLDEAYVDFSRRPKPDYAALLAAGRTVILRTFSKNYGLAGARAAYLVGPPDLVKNLNKIRQPFNLNLLAQVGALAALSDHEHLKKSQEATWAGLAYLHENLASLGLSTHPTEANFLMVGPIAMGADELERALLKKGLIIRSLSSFGLPSHARISTGLPQENAALIAALSQILA
jgi:histidinol-phosphate aminotransferase